ncbi:hypothetical protein LOY38_06240 [Pseudomonas sp. B21-015]|uniref:hypothetical protein n=1 Tax=Pseudomonas sp. B21-015 TaxID=2895473 RepID=UPI0021610296|nr:hypothetical protein [Pseudomonas sp. B21-015]UVM51640.1 hypothetical protein LOY38_06240 [Pseudomonas sp. B21-015]
MNGPIKYRLQPLRIPSGWRIEVTDLFELELTPNSGDGSGAFRTADKLQLITTIEWFVLQPQAVRR